MEICKIYTRKEYEKIIECYWWDLQNEANGNHLSTEKYEKIRSLAKRYSDVCTYYLDHKFKDEVD